MRVVEESASSTSCAIMSEEKSSNGTESDGSNSKKSQRTEQNHSPSSEYHSEQGYALPGGRLKFFKGTILIFLSVRMNNLKLFNDKCIHLATDENAPVVADPHY